MKSSPCFTKRSWVWEVEVLSSDTAKGAASDRSMFFLSLHATSESAQGLGCMFRFMPRQDAKPHGPRHWTGRCPASYMHDHALPVSSTPLHHLHELSWSYVAARFCQ